MGRVMGLGGGTGEQGGEEEARQYGEMAERVWEARGRYEKAKGEISKCSVYLFQQLQDMNDPHPARQRNREARKAGVREYTDNAKSALPRFYQMGVKALDVLPDGKLKDSQRKELDSSREGLLRRIAQSEKELSKK